MIKVFAIVVSFFLYLSAVEIENTKPSLARVMIELVQTKEQKAITAYSKLLGLEIKKSDKYFAGSAIVINKDGYIATNSHILPDDIIKDSFKIYIRIPEFGDYEASVVHNDLAHDLAILKINKTDLKPISLGNSTNSKIGDNVFASGFPKVANISVATDREPTFNKGAITAFKETNSEMKIIQTDAKMGAGQSGGGLLNEKGELIGITFMTTNQLVGKLSGFFGNFVFAEGAGYSIPVEILKDLLKSQNIVFSENNSQTNQTISAVSKLETTTVVKTGSKSDTVNWVVVILGILGLGIVGYIIYSKTKKSSFSIHCTNGSLRDKEYKISNKPLTIGRNTTNDIIIADETVSSNHAQIYTKGGNIYIKDLNSTNGTFINGSRISSNAEVALKIGAKIKFSLDSKNEFEIK